MRASTIVTNLSKKYAALSWELEACEKRVSAFHLEADTLPFVEARILKIKRHLRNLEDVILLFDERWTIADVKFLRPYGPYTANPIPRYALSRGAMAVLRAAKEPLSAREIVERIFEAGLPNATPDDFKPSIPKVKRVLKAREARGLTVSTGRPARWSLVRKAPMAERPSLTVRPRQSSRADSGVERPRAATAASNPTNASTSDGA